MKSLINIPEKMKALVLYGVGDLRVTEVDVPKLEKGTVLLKIRRAEFVQAICQDAL